MNSSNQAYVLEQINSALAQIQSESNRQIAALDAASIHLNDVLSFAQNLELDAFKKAWKEPGKIYTRANTEDRLAKRKAALVKKLERALLVAERQRIDNVVRIIENGILKRSDGCRISELRPDRNDWLAECADQATFLAHIEAALSKLVP